MSSELFVESRIFTPTIQAYLLAHSDAPRSLAGILWDKFAISEDGLLVAVNASGGDYFYALIQTGKMLLV